MIRDYLIPALKKEFKEWEITFDVPPQPIATFPERQPEVGKVLVCDDGHEVTVYIEKVTHGHFSLYDDTISKEERAKIISEEVVDFLKALFTDRVLLHTSADNRMGGWMRLDFSNGQAQLNPTHRYFLWSKPFLPNAK